MRLAQGRERGWDDQHVLLRDHAARGSALGRPDAILARLFANIEALLRVLIRPDVAPAVEASEFGMAGKDQRRTFGAFPDCGAPAVDLLGDRARTHRIDADFVEVAVLGRT